MTFKEVIGVEGPVFRIGTLVFEIIYGNIIWLLFGGPAAVLVINLIPIEMNQVTYIIYLLVMVAALLHMGPATTAIFSAFGKRQRGEETYTFRDFWHSYKQNYKQAIVIALFSFIFIGVLGYSIFLEIANYSLFGSMLYVVIPVQGFVILEFLFTMSYIYALLARFEMSTKNLIKYAFMMSNKHLPTTVVCAVLLLAGGAGFYFWNMASSMFLFGVSFYIMMMLLERVFRNYMPDEDEEFAAEEVEGFDLSSEQQAIIDRYTGKIKSEDDKNS